MTVRRALIVGGSMSGLFAAILLRRAGFEAAIYERSDMELTGRGAGIVTYAETWAVLRAAGCDPSRDLGIEVAGRRVLDREGRIVAQRPCPQTLTSWDRVYRMLREQLAPAHYHLGKELMRIETQETGVVAHFADGSRAEAELLIGADGFRSTVRAQIFPDIRPGYAGYVAWRGLVDEAALSPATHAAIFDAMVFCLPRGEQFLSYPVAGPNNDLRPGHRRCNFVWYRPAEEATALREMLTDAKGRTHALGIPPPLVRAEIIAAMRAAAQALLPPPLAELVMLSPLPFLQPIYDVESARMAAERVAVLGDAAFLARPHVGAGVTKAAEDAMALVASMRGSEDIAAALHHFERQRLALNHLIITRGRDLGAYLQPDVATPEQRAKAERHRTPDAVLSEVALLDFLRM